MLQSTSHKNIYFLGIGGIGMSAIARYFHSKGKNVSGYDKTKTALTAELESEGIKIHYEDDIKLIDPAVLADKENTLVVLTPAVPADHSEWNYLKQNGYTIKKRSEVLGLITADTFCIAVGGTHGKTTTSSMVAHLLNFAGYNCTAFLGGITKNYNSNLILGDPAKGKEYVVVEADEYDRSFLALHPDITIITSMDADHLDIYGDKDYMTESYRLFASQLKPGGKLIYHHGLPLQDIPVDKEEYSSAEPAFYHANNVRIEEHRYRFNWSGHNEVIKDLTSEMPGLHNVNNAVAAITVARLLGVSASDIQRGLAAYTGVRRRFDYQLRNKKYVFIDDYAHHPEELRACISSVKELYPGRKVTGIFQPHLFTRTRDFAEGFSSTLSMLDQLILLDIYPARELPIEGVTSEMIFKNVHCPFKIMTSKENALAELSKLDLDVIVTLGAGDIDRLVEPIKNYLERNSQ